MIVGVEVEARDLFVGDAVDRPAPDEAGEHLGEVARQAKRLPHLGDRAAGAIAGDDGGQRGAVPPIGLVNPLDDLLAPLMLEIDIDIGRLLALARDKALERSEEHTSELQSLMRISYAVFCLKKKKTQINNNTNKR